MDGNCVIRVGREGPVFSRGDANEGCESGHPPRRPHRHCQEQAVDIVCVVGCIFADATCKRMLYVTCAHSCKMAVEVVDDV